MLVSIRQTCHRALPRLSSFSTTAVVCKDINKSLSNILADAGQSSRARLPPVKRISQQHWQTFEIGRAISSFDLTLSGRTMNRNVRRRAAVVAPGPEAAIPQDSFYQLNLDPRDFTTNPTVLSYFVTEMGKIKPRTQTKLTSKSQRLLGKTIRRSKMMGVIPTLSRAKI